MMLTSRLAWLALALTAMPCAAQIDDQAELFSAQKREQAKTRIQEIHERTSTRDKSGKLIAPGKQIMVLTLKKVPDDIRENLNLEDAGMIKEAFDKLARERMKKANADGIHLLICQDPQHIQVTVTDGT